MHMFCLGCWLDGGTGLLEFALLWGALVLSGGLLWIKKLKEWICR